MTKAELEKYLDIQFPTKTDGYWVVSGHHGDFSGKLLEFINQHVKEVIGEDEEIPSNYEHPDYEYECSEIEKRNDFRDELRKKAEL